MDVKIEHVVAAACAAGIMAKADELAAEAIKFQQMGFDIMVKYQMELINLVVAEAEKYREKALEPYK